MKKALFLVAMVALLVLSVVTSAFASAVYFDYTLGGKEKNAAPGSPSQTTDRDNYLLGVEVPLGQFKVAAEYESATVEGAGFDTDVTNYMVKGGYRLVNNDVFQLYGDLSYFSSKRDMGFGSFKYSPFMIGVDAKFTINENMFISGNLDYAVSGKTKQTNAVNITTDRDTDYMAAKVKYTYLFTKNLGASVGYSWSNEKITFAGVGDNTITATGLTLGVTYNF